MNPAQESVAEIDLLYRKHGPALVLFALRMGQLSAAQRSRLQNAVAVLGNGLDWPAAAQKDLEALGAHYSGDSRASVALRSIVPSYIAFLKDESNLPRLMDAISHASPELAQLIPNPKRVDEQKQELSNKLQQTHVLLQWNEKTF